MLACYHLLISTKYKVHLRLMACHTFDRLYIQILDLELYNFAPMMELNERSVDHCCH